MNTEDFHKLKMLLVKYHELTSKLIELLEMDNFDNIQDVFALRQNIISEIDTISFDVKDFKQISESISLLPLQKKLTLLMNEKKSKVKSEINNLEGTKIANKNYNKGFSIDSLYFNKKI